MASGVLINCTRFLSSNSNPLYVTAVARASRLLNNDGFRLYTYLLTAGDSCLRFDKALVAECMGMDVFDIDRGLKALVNNHYLVFVKEGKKGNDDEYDFCDFGFETEHKEPWLNYA